MLAPGRSALAAGSATTGREVARYQLVAPGEVSLQDEHYGGPARPPARAVRPRSQAERSFLALGEVAERYLRAGAPAGTQLEPADLEACATLAYIEMLTRGYTSVGEFHYLHHDPTGARCEDPAELSGRIIAAARAAGIALTLLPAFYTSGGIGRPPDAGQRRFTTTLDEYVGLLASLDRRAEREPLLRVGAAPHSLRALGAAELRALLEARPAGPVHIHAAERTEEIEEVEEGLGARPVEWLLANTGVDAR